MHDYTSMTREEEAATHEVSQLHMAYADLCRSAAETPMLPAKFGILCHRLFEIDDELRQLSGGMMDAALIHGMHWPFDASPEEIRFVTRVGVTHKPLAQTIAAINAAVKNEMAQ